MNSRFSYISNRSYTSTLVICIFNRLKRIAVGLAVFTMLASSVAVSAATSRTSNAFVSRFASAVTYGSGGLYAVYVVIADVNGDGRPDVVVTNNCGNSAACDSPSAMGVIGVLLGNGDGTFQTAVTYGSGGTAVGSAAVADVNGDGKPDMVVVNGGCSSAICSSPSNIGVLLGNGDGTFQTAVTYGSGELNAYSVAVADVNGDGKPDVVVSATLRGNGLVGVLLGNGDGTFQTAVNYSAGNGAGSAVVADVNGDGKPDVVVSATLGAYGLVGVLLGNGDGTLQTEWFDDTGGLHPQSVVLMDVNGDGKADVVISIDCLDLVDCSSVGGVAGVLLGNGDGTFQTAVTYRAGGLGTDWVAVADVNGDGKPDLIAANFQQCDHCDPGSIGVLQGNGDGTFQTAVTFASGANGTYSVAVADVNGDGKPDLITANRCADENCGNGAVGVLINTSAPGTTTAIASSLNSSNFGQPVTFTATVTPQAKGTPTGTVSFEDGTINIGNAPLNLSGVATLTTSTLEPGAHSITATYSGDTKDVASSSSGIQLNVVDFQIGATPPIVTVNAPGGSGTTMLVITPLGGFSQPVSFTCSDLPSEADCSFTNTAVGAKMTITTTAPIARLDKAPFARKTIFYAMLLPGFLGLVCAGSRKRTLCGARMLTLLSAVGLCSVLLGCGGSSGGSNGGQSGTPTGTTTVTLTSTSGSLSHQTAITLTVQ